MMPTMATQGATRRKRSADAVSETFVQLQSKVPPEIREVWKQAATENGRSLSMLFEDLAMGAEAQGQSLGALLQPLLPVPEEEAEVEASPESDQGAKP